MATINCKYKHVLIKDIDKDNNNKGPRQPWTPDVGPCRHCGGGHWNNECPTKGNQQQEKPANQGKANITKAESSDSSSSSDEEVDWVAIYKEAKYKAKKQLKQRRNKGAVPTPPGTRRRRSSRRPRSAPSAKAPTTTPRLGGPTRPARPSYIHMDHAPFQWEQQPHCAECHTARAQHNTTTPITDEQVQAVLRHVRKTPISTPPSITTKLVN